MNNEKIEIEPMIHINQALNYFDGRLFDRLADDMVTDIREFFTSGLHLLAKYKDRVVGIVSFSSMGGRCFIIHPKIKQEFMLYAERICNAALDYAKNLEECPTILAIIPEQFKANIKMAERTGFNFSGMIPESFMKNGRLFNQLIYCKRL